MLGSITEGCPDSRISEASVEKESRTQEVGLLTSNLCLEVDAPLVFQCITCRAIVGDSFSWVNADEELQIITLSKGNLNTTYVNKISD
jgi:hypothetical protein